MEERARFDRLDDSWDDATDSLGGTAPSESAGLPALDRLQRTASGSLPGSPEVHQGQEGKANEEALGGRRWSDHEDSREAYNQSQGQGEEPWKGAGTPGDGTAGDGTAGDGTPLQSPSAASDRFPPSASLTGFNGAPSSSLHDRRLLFGAGSRSARFAQVPRSSSKHLASDAIPTWRPRGKLNMEMTVLQHKTVWEKALNAYNFVIKVDHCHCAAQLSLLRALGRSCPHPPGRIFYAPLPARVAMSLSPPRHHVCVLMPCVTSAAKPDPLCGLRRGRPHRPGRPLHPPLPAQVAGLRRAARLRRRMDQPGHPDPHPRGGVPHDSSRGVPSYGAEGSPRPARLHFRVSTTHTNTFMRE